MTEDIRALLQELGFSDYESRIYLQLLSDSPGTGYQLSQVTGIHRANTYQTLESLIKKEAVISDGSKPKQYSAVEPDDLLSNIQSKFSSTVRKLRDELSRAKNVSQNRNLFVLRGYDELVEKMKTILCDSENEVLAILGTMEMKTLSPFPSSKKSNHARIILLTYNPIEAESKYSIIQVPPAQWMIKTPNQTIRWVAMVEKDSQAVFGFVNDTDREKMVSYWTRNPEIVFSQCALLSQLLGETSKDFSAKGESA